MARVFTSHFSANKVIIKKQKAPTPAGARRYPLNNIFPIGWCLTNRYLFTRRFVSCLTNRVKK